MLPVRMPMENRSPAQGVARAAARTTLWLMLATALSYDVGWILVWPLTATAAILGGVLVWAAMWADVEEAREAAESAREARGLDL